MVWCRRLLVYSPNLGQWDLDRFGPAGAQTFRDWSALIKAQQGICPEDARVAAFPCGALQLGGGEYKR
jgi:hypothetical protein